MKRLFPLALLISLSACVQPVIEQNRSGYAKAEYYARLTPYYSNHLAFSPNIYLRAVEEVVGVPFQTEDGTVIDHADQARPDIELFFARPVPDQKERRALSLAAIALTCPQSDLTNRETGIDFDGPEYIVFQNLPCLGHAP